MGLESPAFKHKVARKINQGLLDIFSTLPFSWHFSLDLEKL